jgi:hypothetical protein
MHLMVFLHVLFGTFANSQILWQHQIWDWNLYKLFTISIYPWVHYDLGLQLTPRVYCATHHKISDLSIRQCKQDTKHLKSTSKKIITFLSDLTKWNIRHTFKQLTTHEQLRSTSKSWFTTWHNLWYVPLFFSQLKCICLHRGQGST